MSSSGRPAPCSSGDSTGWSCGSETLVKLEGLIPQRARLDLLLEISEAAAKGELEFVVGDSSFKGTLPVGVFAMSLSFNNSSASESMIVRSIAKPGSEFSADDKLVKIISINKVTR